MKLTRIAAAVCCFALTVLSMTGCFDEQHPGTYYTFHGKTVASALEENPEYSQFVKVLKHANKGIWSELSTYGHYTCFAPNNAAIDSFLVMRSETTGNQYFTVDDLPPEDCDTLAWTHLLNMTCFVGEMVEGPFPVVNMNDRYMQLSFDSTLNRVVDGDSIYELHRRINNNAQILVRDDTCENGVIHYIDNCIDFRGVFVYDLVDTDPNTTLFSHILKITGYQIPLNEYYDMNYHLGSDSVYVDKGKDLNSAGNKYKVYYWEKRKSSFTLLVEPDWVYRAKIPGLSSATNDLEIEAAFLNYAKKVYPDYNDVDSIMQDYTHPLNPLNRFVGYHILPFMAGISNFNARSDIIEMYSVGITDPEDYFETMAPGTLMRISTVTTESENKGDHFINRRGCEGNGTLDFDVEGRRVRGIRILPPIEMNVKKQIAMNGTYHYIDDILVYDETVRTDILRRRIRIDCCTLSPDFITSGARQKMPLEEGEKRGTGFVNPKNFDAYNSEFTMSVRAASTSSYAYQGDGIDTEGNFDMYVKLPPVPCDGTWQLRVSFRSNSRCGIVQYYIAGVKRGTEVGRGDWTPLGLPIDLRYNLTKDENPNVGWVKDSDLEDEDEINALDKSMKNRGWMKGSDSQRTNDKKTTHRNVDTMGRLILSTDYMYNGMDYYLRIKQLLDDDDAQYLFDYLEFVPKEVYDFGEDKH